MQSQSRVRSCPISRSLRPLFQYKGYRNQTLLMDLVSCILATNNQEIDFRGTDIASAYASTSDFSGMRVTNLHVGESIIAKLVIVGAHVENVT